MTDRTLSEALKAYRDRHGLTQQRLAEERGISLDTLQEWERERGGKSAMARFLASCLDDL